MRTLRWCVSCAVAASFSMAAQADITMQERVTIGGFGGMSLANMSGTTTTSISGDRARTESDLKFESGLLRTFAAAAGKSTEIVRLDQDKIYTLDTKKKTYTEMTFADQRASMQQAMEKMQEGAGLADRGGVGRRRIAMRVVGAESGREAHRREGTYRRISGGARHYRRDAIVQGQEDRAGVRLRPGAGSMGRARVRSVERNARVSAAPMRRRWALARPPWRDFAERAESMFGRYKGIWTEVAAKMHDVKGYPVKASFGLGVGGPQCQNAQQTQAQGDQQSQPQSAPPSIGGALGGALGGLFKKKDAQPAAAAPAPTTMPGGLIPLMTVGSELLSVNQAAVNPQAFEVPADFKKSE